MAEVYVYASDCEDFSNFGLVGALTPEECIFEEESNGMSEITLTHPLDAQGRYTALVRDNLLAVEVPVRTTPAIEDGTIITSVEQWIVRDEATVNKKLRYLYKRKKGSSKLKVLPGGEIVTVVEKSDEGRYKVKSRYGTGYMEPDGLIYSTAETIADNSQSIESVQPAWTVKMQIFRIYSVEKSMDSVTASARHISYDLLSNLTDYKTNAAVSCKAALAGIMDNCYAAHEFEAFTNLADERTGIDWTRVNPINALLDPDTGLTARFGAALVRDNWELYILHDPGLNRGVTVEYAKNMTGITCTESAEDVVTRIIPLGETKDGEDLLLEGDAPWVDSPNIGAYPTPRIQVLQCENCKVGTDKVTTAIARARMKEQAQAVFDAGGDLPEIEMSVEFVTLGDTAEYAQYKDLDRLFLWDYVIVRHKKLNIDVTARVVAIKWDCLRGRMLNMEIGQVGKTLANTGITTWQIPSGVSGSKIANGTITGSALADSIISARHVQADTINTDALQAKSVTADKIAANAITADKIQAGSITADKIQAGAVTADKIQAGSITGDKIAANTITAINIAGETITADQLVAGLITADCGLIANGAIQTAQIADGSITAAKIVSLNADVITSGTIKADRLLIAGDDGLIYQINATSAGLTASQLTEEQYKNQINGTVIVAKSITAAQIAAETITGNEIAANTITAAKLNVSSLFASEAFISLLRTSRIVDGKSIEMIVGDVEQNAEDIIASRSFSGDTPPTGEIPEGKIWVDTGTDPSVIRRWRGLDVTTDAEYSGSGSGMAVETPNGTTAFDQIRQSLEASQNGSGDPTPENIRAFDTLRSGAELTRNGETFTLDFGQTVAVGEVEWTTGKLTITKKVFQLDGVTNRAILSGTGSYGNIFRVDIPGIQHAASTSTVGDVACSHYVATTGNKIYSGVQGIAVSIADDVVQIFDTERIGMTADEYNSYLAAQYAAGTPVQILYALAEPEEVQLGTLDIRPISGEVNTLSVTDGDLTVNYTASGWETVSSLEELNNGLNEALRIANAAVSQEEFQRVVRTDAEGLHVGDNLTEYEVLIDSASVNVVASGKKVSSFSTNFIRLDNMQIRKVRGGLAISVYKG